MTYSKSVHKLISLFGKFPTVGPRTAGRFVFYLLSRSNQEIGELADAIAQLKENVKYCKQCFFPFEKEGDLCEICQNPARDKKLLCVIEKESDFTSLENTKQYNGLYFILGGTVSALKKTDIEKLRISELEIRLKTEGLKEVILATNPTPDGEATALYLERLIKQFNLKITRLARGLPIGGELEYADEETLKNALEGRK